MKLLKTILSTAIICASMVMWQCAKNPAIADGGTSSEVVGKILKEDGNPAPNTEVKLLPHDYDPVIDSILEGTSARVDTTDASGAYSFTQLDTGSYNIEATHVLERTRLLIRQVEVSSDSLRTVRADTLHKPGSVRIFLPSTADTQNGYVYIPGTTGYGRVQQSGDSLYAVVDSVPTGLIPALLYAVSNDTTTPVVVAEDIVVSPEGTVILSSERNRAVTFSVGVQTSALFAGTASAQGGTLTLSSPAPDNVGIGDEVRVAQNRFYISGRNSSVSFTLQTATGMAVGSFGTQTVSIYRAFPNLNAAVHVATGNSAADSNHLNTADLVAADYQLNIACYGDGTDTTVVNLDGWTTGPTNYIRIFTPTAPVEVGVSQRHAGKWDAGKYNLSVADTDPIYILDNHVRVDGLQVLLTLAADSNGGAITCYGDGTTSPMDFRISNNICRGNISNGQTGAVGISPGIWDVSPQCTIRVWNNIVYDMKCIGGHALQQSGGVMWAYNNTFYNCTWGLESSDNTLTIARNNIVQKCDIGFFGTMTEEYNITDLAESLTGTGSRNLSTAVFVDSIGRDFHLAVSDTIARNSGTDLSGDPYLPFATDIEGNLRQGAWDIGADETP